MSSLGVKNETGLRSYITENEGSKKMPYKDTEGHWTVGIGHKMSPQEDTKWTKEQVQEELKSPQQCLNSR